MDEVKGYRCCRCKVKLVNKKVGFSYLGCDFSNDILACPVCGQVYIPESTVKDKMEKVEQALEGK